MTRRSTPPPPPSDPDLKVGIEYLEPIAREPTASRIARRIRDGIIEGTLLSGTQLTETRLAEQLGLSRAPVREALQRLIQEGLAENRARGVFVRELTSDDVKDVYFARTACELAAVDKILSQPSDVDWVGLEERLRVLEQATETDHMRADRRFHESLVESAGSPRLTRMFHTLMAETAICLQQLEHKYEHIGELAVEHREILEAVRAGDRTRAIRAINDHMEDAVVRLTDDHESTSNS